MAAPALRWPRRYIAYAKRRCSPRLTPAAKRTLQNYYVQVRQGLVADDAEAERRGRAPRAVPITVRQLEAIIRISESVARMRLSELATEDDVQTAIHMFTVSTLRAAKLGDVELEGGEAGAGVRTAEEHLRKRVQMFMSVRKDKLLGDLTAQGIEMGTAQRALNALVRQGDFQETSQGKFVKRLR